MDENKIIKYLSENINSSSKTGDLFNHVSLGIGDDAAVIATQSEQYAVTVDTLVEGVHFPDNMDPESLGYRAAAVVLSDLAAMASTPKFATLAITMPSLDESWLGKFCEGLRTPLSAHNCLLIGGDTTKGPLVVTLQMIGTIVGVPLRRNGAKYGDIVAVSGYLGDARAALDFLHERDTHPEKDFILDRYFRPTPRIQFAQEVRKYIHSAIDISDGLIADLGHVARASDVLIEVLLENLPLSDSMKMLLPEDKALEYASVGGDDYELAFTLSPDNLALVEEVGEKMDISVSVIGLVKKGNGVVCLGESGYPIDYGSKDGFKHF